MLTGKEMTAVCRHIRVYGNRVLQKPEADDGGGAAVESIHAGVEDEMSVVRVKGRVCMRDVIRGIRFAGGGQPRSLLDTQAVFGSAALEGVVTFRVDGIGQKVGDQSVRRGAGEHRGAEQL